eukprot:TRINITY_DN37927_c0_g1_i1.p1 TRINITY_DN37927_c0_g1~~TRINITY_DN37927_c0_g1_i1.p1  ORF type:complete len:356 (-),score=66.57 TRINITY_DN37927_c0_g1_i1:755-1783(-)
MLLNTLTFLLLAEQLLAAEGTLADAEGRVVNTTSGQVRGALRDGVVGFLGVPFAAPPVGARRFAMPTEHERWTGVLDAMKQPKRCMQGHSPRDSEDCLYLNAFTPVAGLGKDSDELKPVLVYFHGGGMKSGDAAVDWNFSSLTGSVVFMPQYRLSVFGFFSPELPPPKFGIADQQFALQWVKQNAKAFGGDPDRVLIAGCSAGGASVAGHLVLEESFGLYASAALVSPGGHQGWMGDQKRTNDDWMSTSLNVHNSQAVAVELGCGQVSNLECLRNASSSDLLSLGQQLRFAPAMPVDGQYPLGLISEGKWNRVPTIVGGTSCESCHDAEKMLGPPDKPVSKE